MKHNEIAEFKSELHETIFACMEMSKQSYKEVLLMPFKRFQDYMTWKAKLEEEKQKRIEEEISKGK